MPATLHLLLTMFALAVTSGSPAHVESAPPRYAFKAGQELTCEMNWTNTTHAKSGLLIDEDHHAMKIFVERENLDGSFHLILSDHVEDTRTRDGKKTSEPAMDNLVDADVFPDGRQKQCRPINFGAFPAYLFPPLPASAQQLTAGWTGTVQDFRFEAKGSEMKDQFVFDAKVFSPFYKVLADEHASHYTLDRTTGFVQATDEKISAHRKSEMEGHGGLKFIGIRVMGDDALQQFQANAVAYTVAMAAYDHQLDAAQKAGPDAEKLLAVALDRLKSDAKQLGDPLFRSQLQMRINEHPEVVAGTLKQIRFLNDRIGKPAFAFTANDLDGNVVHLADYRGKVVVLDFWYRGCPWCVRTTPIVNELERDFDGKAVKFFGMSIDTDPADARLVVKQLEIKSTALQAKTLAEKFGVTGYPTLIVVDQDGNVRHFEDGYHANLREDLGKLINSLLQKS